jgi:hypothetical protein
MRVVSQYRRQINQFICSSKPAAFLLAWSLLALALAVLGALFFYMGAPAMNGRPWDVPILLDGAWRIVNGQTPHRDFFSHLGDLPFYVTWLGMKLSRPCVSAITYGNVFLMAPLGLSAMAVLQRRTSALYALAMSLFLALLAVAPRPLGDPFDYTDYAMLYNRYGEAFLGLFGAIIFLPPAPNLPRRWADWTETAFAGALLAILLFCKLNYFFVGAGFFVLACLLGRFSLGEALLCLLSAAVALRVILLVTHIPAAAMRTDFQIMAAAQNLGGRLRPLAVHGLEYVFYLPVLGLMVWEMVGQPGEQNPSLRALWRPLVLIAALFGGALLLLSSNCQEGEMPLLALAGLYCAETTRRNTAGTQEDTFLVTARNLGALALFALFLLPTFATDCKTILFAARNTNKSKWVSTETLQSTHLNDFRFITNGTRFAEMRDYMQTLDEGIKLLRRHSDPQMLLTVLMFSDPYHVALGLAPARGGIVCVADAAMSERSHPPLKRLLGDATHILVDRGGAAIRDAYGAEWDTLHLEVIEQTEHFTLLKAPKVDEKAAILRKINSSVQTPNALKHD